MQAICSYRLHAAICSPNCCQAGCCGLQIGGVRAPSPVGELGNVEMTQALSIVDPQWKTSGPDMLLTGYLPTSGGLEALDAALSGRPPSTASINGTSAAAQAPALEPALAPNGQARRREFQRRSKVRLLPACCL